MSCRSVIIALTFVATVAAAPLPLHDVLMKDIERQLQLPRGAQPLHDYDRFYALEPRGKRVIGVYVLSSKAGQRRWLEDYRKLPSVLDGGCAIVNVRYDIAAESIEAAFCNGFA